MKTNNNQPKKTRREFIKNSTLSATAFTIIPRYVLGGKGFIGSSDKLNIVCVGIGGKSRVDVDEVSSENIIALCDVDQARASEKRGNMQNAYDAFPKAIRYQDFREMLHREPEKEDILFTRAALAMCENIDWNVGRIVEKLGLSENTIIIYLSENGPNSWRWNGGMKGRKGSTDEGGVRSPLFVKWDGTLTAGKTVTEIAGSIDLLSTLADLAGIDLQPEKTLDGVSLKSLLTENNPEWEERLYSSQWGKRTSVRSQRFRLDNQGKLFNMANDPGQHEDVSENFPEITNQLLQARKQWENEVLSELPETDDCTFIIGHPDYPFTHIPARDGIAHGNILRSNRFPNDSFFTNWTSTSDSIIWEAEVLAGGDFEVEIYYTCPPEDVGSTIALSFAGEKLTGKNSDAHNPPLQGMENDRVERMESYVKNFKPMKMGTIHMKKDQGLLTLNALEIPGSQVMDFRLMMLKRIN